MGEQSAKHLRGRAMEDVIFAGSESRGPGGPRRGVADVRRQRAGAGAAPGGVPWGAAAPEEIVGDAPAVSRRQQRVSAERRAVAVARRRRVLPGHRRRDSKAYAIIEQGRIGFIVSSRPEDRRGLIDEAAGITRYKSKKKAAERRDGFDAAAPAARVRHHRRDRGPAAIAPAAGAEGGALQALQVGAEGSGPVVVGAALPRASGGGEVAGRGARRVCARAIRRREQRAGRRRGRGGRGSSGRHRGSDRAGGGEGRSLRAVEQGAARHAARRPPRSRGDRAGGAGRRRPQGDHRAACPGGGPGRQHRGDRVPADGDRRRG